MLYLIPLFQNKPNHMTLVHAIQSFAMCLLSLLLITDFQSSYLVKITMINSFIYFVVDTIYDDIHNKLKIVYLLHHLVSASAICRSTPFTYECIVCLLLCEVSNIFLPLVKSILSNQNSVEVSQTHNHQTHNDQISSVQNNNVKIGNGDKIYVPQCLNSLYIVGPLFYLTFVISRFVIIPVFIWHHTEFFNTLFLRL
jgi:hypothetical protein